MDPIKIIVRIQNAPLRTDLALLRALETQGITLSRNQLKERFQQKQVFHQGRPTVASRILEVGDYEFILNEVVQSKELSSISAEKSFLPIVYEDETLLVLNKESGIPSVPHRPDESLTAVGSALAHYPALAQIGRTPFEPGLLHRLDTGTSGLLVFAKTQAEFDRLSLAWKRREVVKIYRALTTSHQAPPQTPLQIRHPLAHDAKSAKRMIALREGSRKKYRGKPLETVTHLVKVHTQRSFGSSEIKEAGTQKVHLYDFEIQIDTGVMHQIRCHLSDLGYPILGDSIYNGIPSSRLWLHAWRLTIPLSDDQTLSLEAQLPASWR